MFFGLSAKMCFVVIVAIFALVYFLTPRKHIWVPFVVIVVLFAVLAFKFEPAEADDVSRYFNHVNYMRRGGKEALDDVIANDWYGSNTYRVVPYYFYFISKTSSNHYLPAITIFIVYALMFLVLYKAANKFEVNKTHLFLGSMFFISTYWYYDTASGIRNGLAFAVIFACAYYHLVERRNITLCCVGYVLAALTHSAAIMPILLVVLTVVTLNTEGKFIKYFLIFGLAGGAVIIQYLSTVTDNNFIQQIAGRAERHSGGSTIETGTMFLVNLVTFVFVSLLVFYFSKYITEGERANELKRIYKYSCLTIYFLIGCLFSGLIFVRFVRWIIPVIGAMIFMIGMQFQANQLKQLPRHEILKKPPMELYRFKTRGVVMILYVIYTSVHFWYLLQGSSLNWIHF